MFRRQGRAQSFGWFVKNWQPFEPDFSGSDVSLQSANLRHQRHRTDFSRLIYYIQCKDCLKTYIRMIWRLFITKRKKQHISGQNNAIMKRNRTAVVYHVVNAGHRFDCDNMKILDTNSNYGKLKVLEMLHITASNTVNKRSDVSNTIHQYSELLHHLKSKNFI